MLLTCLDRLNRAKPPRDVTLEFVLVDNNSNDHTPDVLNQFLMTSSLPTKIVQANKVGLGHARNRGIANSSGDVLIFTDDDCYLDEDYFINFLSRVDSSKVQYGMGPILLFNENDDPRVATARIDTEFFIPPHTTVIPAGMIQGANMFYLKSVFEKAGLFNEHMGAGTDFPCEDIEMACRASHAGFTGALLPGFAVHHAHGRKRDSVEASKTVASYDHGRGAYYASLLARGVPEVWNHWQRSFTEGRTIPGGHFEQLARELGGAAKYFEFLSTQNASDHSPA